MPIEFANCFTAFLCLIGGAFCGIIFLSIEYALKPSKFLQILKGEIPEFPEEFTFENLQKKVMEQTLTIERLRKELSIYREKFTDAIWKALHVWIYVYPLEYSMLYYTE